MLDVIGLIPIIGALKYSDEVVDVMCKAGKVLDAIDEAYRNGVKNAKSQLEYTMKSGMRLIMNTNENGKIVSAYPEYIS